MDQTQTVSVITLAISVREGTTLHGTVWRSQYHFWESARDGTEVVRSGRQAVTH